MGKNWVKEQRALKTVSRRTLSFASVQPWFFSKRSYELDTRPGCTASPPQGLVDRVLCSLTTDVYKSSPYWRVFGLSCALGPCCESAADHRRNCQPSGAGGQPHRRNSTKLE